MTSRALSFTVFFLWCWSIYAEENSNAVSLSVYAPEVLTQVAFGDPVFVPVASANESGRELMGATFSGQNPDLQLTIQSGDASSTVRFDVDLGTSQIKWVPGTAESTVLLVDVWTEKSRMATLKSKEMKLTFTFDAGEDRSYSLKSSVVVVPVGGTSFEPKLHAELVTKNRTRSPSLDDGRVGAAYSPLSLEPLSPFTGSLTPLSWNRNSSPQSRWLVPGSPEYRALQKAVKPNSTLGRMFKISPLIQQLQNAKSASEWGQIIDKLNSVFKGCAASERQFYLSAISVARMRSEITNAEQRLARDLNLKNSFPLQTSFFSLLRRICGWTSYGSSDHFRIGELLLFQPGDIQDSGFSQAWAPASNDCLAT